MHGRRTIGRMRDDLQPDLRSFAAGSYLIFYRPIDDGIEVVRVLHGARDIERAVSDADQDASASSAAWSSAVSASIISSSASPFSTLSSL